MSNIVNPHIKDVPYIILYSSCYDEIERVEEDENERTNVILTLSKKRLASLEFIKMKN